MNQLRQGDILLIAVEGKIPQGIEPKTKAIMATTQ